MTSGRRIPRKTLIILTVVLGTTAVILGLIFGMRQKRTVVMGRIASGSGLQCRFTLAADWQCEDHHTSKDPKNAFLDQDTFLPPPPGKVKQWITTHLLNRPPEKAAMSRIYLTSGNGEVLPHFMQIREGYPELLTVPPAPYIYTHRHLQIDHHPATFITATAPDSSDHAVGLLVYVPEASLFYFFTGLADSRHIDPLDHEIQEIVASLHIEKAAVLPKVSR